MHGPGWGVTKLCPLTWLSADPIGGSTLYRTLEILLIRGGKGGRQWPDSMGENLHGFPLILSEIALCMDFVLDSVNIPNQGEREREGEEGGTEGGKEGDCGGMRRQRGGGYSRGSRLTQLEVVLCMDFVLDSVNIAHHYHKLPAAKIKQKKLQFGIVE